MQDLMVALVEEVKRHSDGLGATELRDVLQRRGYSTEQIQAAMRQSLDDGTLQLGTNLQLEAA